MFHTSRWDHEVTGKQMEKLGEMRVGIVGTGASAVQVILHSPASGTPASLSRIGQLAPGSWQHLGDGS